MPNATAQTKVLVSFIRKQAMALGFDACRITAAEPVEGSGEALHEYLQRGYHGTMTWMADTQARRSSPKILWPQARSVIMLAINYGPDHDPLSVLKNKQCGSISVYAHHRDYHDVIKGKLKTLASKLVSRARCEIKLFVDTAPLMEKPLAARAGLGWQGKHTNLVSRQFGSWLFLGSIFTTLELLSDIPEDDHCGSCRACLDVCPTHAFPAPYQIDARKCISYLTIEHKGPIERTLRHAIGNRIYGCDDCLAVCPWNKFASHAREAKLTVRKGDNAPELIELSQLNDESFRILFSGSPIKRIGRDRFVRNVAIAIGNASQHDATTSTLHGKMITAAQRLAEDRSPLVRGAAVWALAQLLPESEFIKNAAIGLLRETDSEVLEEWLAWPINRQENRL